MVGRQTGLLARKEAAHIFLSEHELTAFQQTLEICRQREDVHYDGRRMVETRLAGIVRLDSLSSDQTQFGRHGSNKAKERLPFDHVFKPEECMPESPF